ncbi:UNVERIFIED_CONTAM: hypothetical protein K2H54_062401 [Gekko kuhli]
MSTQVDLQLAGGCSEGCTAPTADRNACPRVRGAACGCGSVVDGQHHVLQGQQFSLAWSTVAGIVVEVTRAITERLLERVVYLRNPDRDMAWLAIMSGGTCPCNLASTRPTAPLNVHQGRGGFCHQKRPQRRLLRRLDPPKEPTIRWSWCHPLKLRQ